MSVSARMPECEHACWHEMLLISGWSHLLQCNSVDSQGERLKGGEASVARTRVNAEAKGKIQEIDRHTQTETGGDGCSGG